MTNREAARLYLRWAKEYTARRSPLAALMCLQTALGYRADPPDEQAEP